MNDRRGRFRLELPNRPAMLRVTAPDRLPAYAIATTGQGQPAGPLELALEPGILISG